MKHLSQKGKFICRMETKWKRDGWVGLHAEHSDSVTETWRGSWDVFMLYIFTSETWLKAVWCAMRKRLSRQNSSRPAWVKWHRIRCLLGSLALNLYSLHVGFDQFKFNLLWSNCVWFFFFTQLKYIIMN